MPLSDYKASNEEFVQREIYEKQRKRMKWKPLTHMKLAENMCNLKIKEKQK